ncbi:E3 ubiquitin-protein ligase TRIM33-like, partial [Ruditapes philippinarum]|uniref:E3 ubiquitin-protein ligase TRIM33-like n=1 Tax=Ruditapes philippinarum TaxID=129788 RepID=UPI00295AE942
MATGDDSFSASVTQSSDVVCKFSCSPCNENGIVSEAVFKCLHCQTFLCIRCYEGHNKFVRKHTIVNVNAEETGPKIIQMKGYTCDEHKEKLIEMFCQDHDAVFCSACTKKHRSCKGVNYIPDIADTILQDQNKIAVKLDLENQFSELLMIKSSRKKYLSKLNSDKYKTINAINKFKVKLLKKVEEWEKSSILQGKERYEETTANINSDLHNIDQLFGDVKKQLSKMKEGKYDDQMDEFVTLKLSERQVKKVKTRTAEYMWKPVEKIEFKPCDGNIYFGNLHFFQRPLNAVYIDHTWRSSTFVKDELVPGLLEIGIHSKCTQTHGEVEADVITIYVVSDILDLFQLDDFLREERFNF